MNSVTKLIDEMDECVYLSSTREQMMVVAWNAALGEAIRIIKDACKTDLISTASHYIVVDNLEQLKS